MDPRTPVIVGVGQHNQRVDDPTEADEPVGMMATALGRAADDAGAPGVLAAADAVRVVNLLSWRYRDPARLVAGRVGAGGARTAYTTVGGNTPQLLVNRSALDIQEGRARVVLVCGAEAWRSRNRARAAGVDLSWTRQADDVVPDEVLGEERELSHPAEVAVGAAMPVQIYPVFENALRARDGRSIEEHQVRISELWARFSEVAAANPYAWIQRRYTPEEVRTPSPDNRMIGFPYPKLMNSNNSVEQAAALVLCSVEAARELGVPEDRWVFPHSGTDAHDHWFVSERADLHSSPAIRVAGRRALELAGAGVDDLAHVDLYSCFPSAVQVAATELGLGLDRDLTVTGGLSFAGGPWNDYVTHAIATMVARLRDDPGAVGLCTANGGYLTKHAFGVYSTRPPAGGFRHEEPQAEVDAAAPAREPDPDHTGRTTVESYTVTHDREGDPELGLLACLTPEGRRCWAQVRDHATLVAMTREEACGRKAMVDADRIADLG